MLDPKTASPQKGGMKKSFSIKRVVIPVVIFVLVMGLIAVLVTLYEKYYKFNSPLQCRRSGGNWVEFKERLGCKDECRKINADAEACIGYGWTDGYPAEEIKSRYMGCDCGPNMCWDYEKRKCVGNPK